MVMKHDRFVVTGGAATPTKNETSEKLTRDIGRLQVLQAVLAAQSKFALLIVFQ